MALFDNINSRYTKSMEDGGSYQRDAAIGGYDRKELRGLSKQARRGTLTQRERARYKYLKDERGGRRKRGLLSGLGGAGAVLAGLAASGKLGGGTGAGGAGIMDMIKGRMGKSRADKLGEQGEGGMEEMMNPEAKNVLKERELMESGPGIGEPPIQADMTGFDSRERQGFEGDYTSGGDPVEDLAMSQIKDIPLEEEEDMDEEKVASLLEILKGAGAREFNPNELEAPDQLTPRRVDTPYKKSPRRPQQLDALEQLRHFFGNKYN